jgi:hypothetical protein
MTAMIVLFWCRATRDLLKACPGAGRGRSAGASLALHRLDAATKLPFLAARPIASLGPPVEDGIFRDRSGTRRTLRITRKSEESADELRARRVAYGIG